MFPWISCIISLIPLALYSTFNIHRYLRKKFKARLAQRQSSGNEAVLESE